MDDKVNFISDYLKQYYSVSELCERYNVSRKTGYKWIDRYKENGPDGLHDLSRKPHHLTTKTPIKIEKEIIKLREQHHYWGAKKSYIQFLKCILLGIYQQFLPPL